MDIPNRDQGAPDGRTERVRQLEEFLSNRRSVRRWFIQICNENYYLWMIFTALNLLFSFLTSIFIAVGWPDPQDHLGKAVLVALPAAASFCGTLLVQFRFRETWELRELGRIDVDEAIVQASSLPIDDPGEFAKGLYELRMAGVRLARLSDCKIFRHFVRARRAME